MGIRRALCATAGVVAVVGLAGCGGGGGKPAASGPPTTTAAPPVSVAAATPTAPPSPTPQTPEQKINAIAEAHGWVLNDANGDDALAGLDDNSVYDSPADYVQDICDSLPQQADDGAAQWLALDETPDEMHMLATGVPLLCPDWTKTVKQAASGHYPVYISSGTFKVTSRRAVDTVPPGTYRTTGDLGGCYWERTSADGTIIDNNYATAASRITVTIRASDDSFTSQDCGTWKPVG